MSFPNPLITESQVCVGEIGTTNTNQSQHLPPGWSFVFSEETPKRDGKVWEKLDGLTIVTANRQKYRTVENAMRHNWTTFQKIPFPATGLYDSLGIQLTEAEVEELHRPGTDAKEDLKPLSLKRLAHNNSDKGRPGAARDIVQEVAAFQPAGVEAPPSYANVNVEVDCNLDEVDGEDAGDEENDNVNGTGTKEMCNLESVEWNGQDPCKSNALLIVRAESTEVIRKGGPVHTSALHQLRCKKCQMCNRLPCGVCANCKYNARESSRYPRVCFRKICEELPEDVKLQPALGFPDGWSFYFIQEAMTEVIRDVDTEGLVIVDPDGFRFSRLRSALEYNCPTYDMVVDIWDKFLENIGTHRRVLTLRTHKLLMQPVLFRWVRDDGKTVGIEGVVQRAEFDEGAKKLVFTVTFDERSTAVLQRPNGGWNQLPTTVQVDRHLVWDGYKNWKKYTGESGLEVPNWSRFQYSWLVPSNTNLDLVASPEIIRPGYDLLPRLRLTYMGYVLTFSVKKSSRWPTEHGVFLSVERIQKCAPMVFQLGVGQGLDFDVCGPYRPEDCCSTARRIVKSLILSFFHRKHCRFERKEEMNVDYCLDLSNDHNWDLHSNARVHVAPYVNFVVYKDDITPTVYAQLDVEGSLHYFLGHKDSIDGPFEFPADGTEREIFVDLDEDNKDEVSFVSIAEQNTNMVCQNSDYLITTLPCKFL